MAVKSFAQLQREARGGVKPLGRLRAEALAQTQAGRGDPWLGRQVGFRVQDYGVPPLELNLLGTDDAVFEDVRRPLQFGTVTGRQWHPDEKGVLQAWLHLDLGVPEAVTLLQGDAIAQAILDEHIPAETPGERIGQYFRHGQITVQLADLGFEVLTNQDTPATWREIERLRGELKPDPRAKMRAWWEKALSATAEQLPLLGEVIQAAPAGALAGGLGGMLAGGVVSLSPTLGEELAIPAMTWAGVKLGAGAAGAYRIGQIEAGLALLDLLEAGVDPAVAKAAAYGVGVLNGVLEMAQLSLLLRTLPGGQKLARHGLRAVVNKLVKQGTLRNLAARHTAQFGAYLGTETLQELAQESSNIVAEEFTKYLQRELNLAGGEPPVLPDWTAGPVDPEAYYRAWAARMEHPPAEHAATLAEIKQRYTEIGAKSLQGFTVLGLPGTVVSSAVDIDTLRKQKARGLWPVPRDTWIPARQSDRQPTEQEARHGPTRERPMVRPEPQEAAQEAGRAIPVEEAGAEAAGPDQLLQAEGEIEKRVSAYIAHTYRIRPAIRLDGRDIYVGQPGQAHFHVQRLLPEGWWNRRTETGWVDPQGTWLTQAEAAQRVQQVEGTAPSEKSIWQGHSGYLRAVARKALDEQGSSIAEAEALAAEGRAAAQPRLETGVGQVTAKPPVLDLNRLPEDVRVNRRPQGPEVLLPEDATAAEAAYLRSVGYAPEGESRRLWSFQAPPAAPAVEAPPGLTAARATPGEIEAALGDISWPALKDKAREIGLKVKGKKAQLAALVSATIKEKAGQARTTAAERQALRETEAAIRAHPLYEEFARDVGLTPGRIDPRQTYYVEEQYRGDVRGYVGEPGTKGYNAALAARITFDQDKGGAWDDSAAEQGLGHLSFDEFMDNLRDAVAAEKTGAGGIMEAALESARESEDPYLEMLVEKRRLLRAGFSAWDINQRLAAVAADYGLERGEYEELLLAGGYVTDPSEPHPGSLPFRAFFEKLGAELADPDSEWIRQWQIDVTETPRQWWRRLRNEWEAIRAHRVVADLDLGQVAEAEKLTAEQEQQLSEIDAEQIADEILQTQKDVLVGRLVSGIFDDARELNSLRRALLSAYRAGTKEGIAKARAAYRTAQQKVKARKELREYVAKLLRQIKAPAGPSIAFTQRKAIELIQGEIDPRFRQKRTVAERRAAREFFEKHPEAQAPAHVRALVQQKAPGELTVEQLEQVARAIGELRHKGRIRRKQQVAERAERLAADRAALLGSITGGRPPAVDMGPLLRREPDPIRQRVWNTYAWTLTPERLLDAVDGMQAFHGPALEIFWQRVRDAENAKVARIHQRTAETTQVLQDLGLTYARLNEPALQIHGRDVTVQEAVGLYNFNRNYASRLAVTFGNRIGARDLQRVVEFVEADPQLRPLADWIVDHYERHYARLRQAVIDADQRDLGKEENYTPMRRMERTFTPDERQIRSELQQRHHFKRGYAEKGMTLSRQDIKPEYQQPIRLDAWNLLLQQIPRQEHYIAYASLVKDLHALLSEDEIAEAVTSKFGPETYKLLRNYVDATANPNIYRQFSADENLVRLVRRHTTVAYLAYKVSTALKQLLSLALYLPDAGLDLLAVSARAPMEFATMRRFMIERDPMQAKPALERELEEMRHAGRGTYREIVRQWGTAGLKGLYVVDAVARTIGWSATYQHQYKVQRAAGLDPVAAEDAAVKAASLATSRTQPAARAFQIPQLYRSNEAFNLMLQFTNQLSKLFNLATYDWRTFWKQDQYGRAAATFVALGLNAGLIWTITHRRLPESDEDLVEALKEQSIGSVPLLGPAYLAYERGFGAGEIAGIEGAAEFVVNVKKALGQFAETGQIDWALMHRAYRGLAPVLGLPYTGPKNLLEFLVTGEPIYLLGGPSPDRPVNPKSRAAQQRRARRQRK